MNEGHLKSILRELDIKPLHKNYKGWVLCKCPFAPWNHEGGKDLNPSFYVRIDEDKVSGFNCYTCKEKGSVRSMIMKLGNVREEDYSDLAHKAFAYETPSKFDAFDTSSIIEEENAEPLSMQVYMNLYPCVTGFKDAVAYLRKRGISTATALKCKLRYCVKESRILFPVIDYQGDLWGFSGRRIVEDKEFPKVRDYDGLRKEKVLLGEHLIDSKNSLPMLIVEGLFAWLTMIELGVDKYANVIATLGANVSDWQRDLVVYYDRFTIMLYDNDYGGDDGLYGAWNDKEEKHEGHGAIDKLRSHIPLALALYPKGISDPDYLSLAQVRNIVDGDYELA